MKTKSIIFLFVFATIIFTSIMLILGFKYEEKNNKTDNSENLVLSIKVNNIEKENKKTIEIAEETNLNFISLGEFKLTAYCNCTLCCGRWAYNRPIDEQGNEIIYGSTGEVLTAGVSVAVDPSIIPYGSKVVVNGHTYIAQDTGGAIKGNRMDIYHNSHQEALEFGVQYAEVFLVDSNNY